MDKTDDDVNHPTHYTSHPSGLEIIELTRWMPFNLGNAFKYLARANLKHESPLKDLKKAQWYVNDYADNYKQLMPYKQLLWGLAQKAYDETSYLFFRHETCLCMKMIHEITTTHRGLDMNLQKLQRDLSEKIRKASEQQTTNQ